MKKQTISILTSMLLFSQLGASEKLEGIVVTAKSPSAAIDTAGSYIIITQEDIQKMNANTIAEVMEEKAGITTGVNSSSIYGRSSISLRGMESRNSLILIDGRRVSSSDALMGHSDFAYSWVPMGAIEKIEIIKGPMSALYGSSALGGVVNIITKKPTEKFTGEIDLKHGISSAKGGDEQKALVTLCGGITDSLSASFSAELSDIEPVLSDGDTAREGKEIKSGVMNLWYDIDDTQQIMLSSMKGNETRDILGFNEYYDNDKSHDAIEYRKYFGDIKLNAKYYKTSLDSHNDDLDFTNKMDDDIFNLEFAFGNFKDHFIILGAEKRVEKYHKAYDFTPVKDFKNKIDYTSFYLQDEINIDDDFIFTIGSRYDKHEQFGGELSPKASLVYKLSGYDRLKGSYGHGFNAPSLTQNSNSYILAVPIKLTPPMEFNRFHGNSDLKPETSDSFELAYEHQKEQSSYKAAIFYTKAKDLITTMPTSTTMAGPIKYNERTYLNVDEATIYGLELEWEQKNLLSNLDVYLGYSYLNTQDEKSKEDLPLRPQHKANLRLTSKLPYDIKSTLRINYIGEQYSGETDLDPYLTLGLQFEKKLNDSFAIIAGADNLTDKELESDYSYQLKNRVVYTRLNYKF